MTNVPLLRGHRVPAGLGHATVVPECDLETYSEAGYVWDDAKQRWSGLPGAPGNTRGLSLTGTEPYARHPTADTIWFAYDLKDGAGRRRWRPGLPPPLDLWAYVASGGPLEAWNVGFERWWWEHVLTARHGWPLPAEHQWRCAMAKARASSYPGNLADAGRVLRLATQKDAEGAKLMRVFSMPRQPTKGDPRRRILPVYTVEQAQANAAAALAAQFAQVDPTRQRDRSVVSAATRITDQCLAEHRDTLRYGDYNETDIEVEAAASLRLPDLDGDELTWWQIHERINRRGVHIDRVGLENCSAVVEQAFATYHAELFELTSIDAATKVQQLQGWLHGQGVHLDSLDEEAVTAALAGTLPPAARRVLEIRAAVGSASIKKLFSIRNRLSADDRLRDLYIYYGARTGRSTGEGPQPTNLPKAGPDTYRCGGCGRHHGKHLFACPHCGALRLPDARSVEWSPDVAADALDVVATRSLQFVELVFGDALHAIAGCLRALFDAAPEHDLIGTDYNSIEAVGLAMVSGEKWRIDVFNGDGKIYERSASMMYKVPYEEFAAHKARTGQHHHLRQKGKIGELAFGFQGWLGAAAAFGMPGTDDEIKSDILAWRAASPAVEWLWGGQTLGKAWGVWVNAKAPDYAGVVDDRLHASLVRCEDRWDRTQFYFGVEGTAILALQSPGQWWPVTRLDGYASGVEFRSEAPVAGTPPNVLYCRLPSGRALTYHNPQLTQTDRGEWGISYEGNNTNPKNGPVGWIRMNTWGGRLVENIIQATCRDILKGACIVLEEHGYRVVLHVYDEIVAEIPKGWGSVEEFEALVTAEVQRRWPWCAHWPIRAPGGFRAQRYGKR